MPVERAAPIIPELNLEAEPLKLGLESIEDAYALTTVKQTFWNYERFRSQNHDTRWSVQEALYLGWLPPKTWEGTTTPRSSLGMPITFGQIESAFPAIYQALFNDDRWFQVSPEPGTSWQEALDIQGHLQYSIEHPTDDYTSNTENELEIAIKDVLNHGNGGVEIMWDATSQRPRIEWVDIKDFYVDPKCPTPSIDQARAAIRRRMMSIDEIEALRGTPGMKIPQKDILVHMARNMNYAFGDQTKRIGEALRGISYSPESEAWSAVPAERQIEVLVYYSRHRVIWVFNREWIAFNKKNPYDFIPFAFAPCFLIPGRFYAMSYSDVIENPQRYIEALYNSHLDELALAVRPPRVRKRGSMMTPAQQRWQPGQVQEVDDPKNDVAVLYPQGATANIMEDVSYLEAMVEKLTGVNSVGMGVPRPGNANRTATGMNLQAQGGTSRLWPLVKHIEDYLIVPMLYKMYRMVQIHTYPGQQLPSTGQQKNQYGMVNSQSFQKKCKFTIEASSKMLTRDKLAQMVPFLAQYLFNGPFIQSLQSTGMTVDFQVFARMMQDATGTGDMYPLFRQMTQQEQQAKQAPPPQAQMQMQQAQMDQQTRLQMGQMKAQSEIQKAQIMKQPDPNAAQQFAQQQQAAQQEQQMDLMQRIAEIQAEKQKAQIQQQTAQHKMLMDHMTNQQNLQHEREKARQEMFLNAARGQQEMQQQREQHAHDLMVSQAQARQGLEQGAAQGKQKIDQSKALIGHKMDMDKNKMKLQAQAMKQKAALRPAPKKAA